MIMNLVSRDKFATLSDLPNSIPKNIGAQDFNNCEWPEFDFRRLPLHKNSQKQLAGIYERVRRKGVVPARKSILSNFIIKNAYVRDKVFTFETLAFVRAGDIVLVHSMDRVAKNLDDLRRIVQSLTKRSIRVEFVKEGLSSSGDYSPMAALELSVYKCIGRWHIATGRIHFKNERTGCEEEGYRSLLEKNDLKIAAPKTFSFERILPPIIFR
jgi:hypothetical protein